MGTIFDRSTGFQPSEESAAQTFVRFTRGRPLAGLRVLDVGCRTGESIPALVGLGAEAWGVDLGERCIATARGRYPALAERFLVADARALDELPVRDFDLVTCIGAMPYLAPQERLPAIGGMARVCRPGGEVRVLFQVPRPRPVQLALRGLELLPEAVFARAVAPGITRALAPFSRRLLGERVPRDELHYRVSLGLYGLHFGFPPSLARYRFGVERCRFISPALSAAFAIPALDALGW